MKEALEQLEKKIEKEGMTDANLKAFWRLVTKAKMQKQLSDEELKQIIELRDAVFEKKYPRFLSLPQGLVLNAISAVFGAFIVSYALQSGNIFVFLFGSFLLLAGTHPWGHWIAGKLVGVNYEYFYLNGPAKFEPCLKIDYRNYLKASFDSRMAIHGSGAFATVLIAIVLLITSFTINSFMIRGISTVVVVLVVATEAVSFAGFATGDLKRARREGRLKRLYLRQREI